MLTRRSHWLFLYIRIKRFPIPLIMPLRIFWECIDALEDLFSIAWMCEKGRHARKAVRTITDVVGAVTSLGKFDLVEVDVESGVKIRMCLR